MTDTLTGTIVFGDRIHQYEIGPARPASPSRVLDAVHALASELRRLGAEQKAEIFEGLACCLKRHELAPAALVIAGVLERQSRGDVRAELAGGRAAIEFAAGSKRRDVRVDDEHLGTAEQDGSGAWHGHLAEAHGASSVAADGGTEEAIVRLMLECAGRHQAYQARRTA